MKILLVTHRFPPSIGGMENQCYELYQGLKKNFNVELYKMPEKANHLWWLLQLGKNLQKHLRKNNDITHVYFNDGLIATAAAAVKKTSTVHTMATIHGLDIVYPASIYQKKIINNLNANIDSVISVSTATAEECISRGVNPEKVFIVPNGVDLSLKDIKPEKSFPALVEEYKLPDLKNKKIIISIGRAVRRKGFSWFLEKVLPLLGSEYYYIMIGPPQKKLFLFRILSAVLPEYLKRLIELSGVGMDQIRIKKLLKRNDIKAKASHIGKIPFKDLVLFAKNSSVFIMPNIHIEGDAEGFGLVALEAVMNGTIPVVADIEGITEAIKDGKNGFYAKSRDASDWVAKFNEITGPDFKRKNFIAKSIKFTENNFSWSKMVEGYSRIILK
ncbi:MAG: glycosyltransferase family 4 protein [Spirochaetes bacterium]|nr:glycosyltransferase family 4 protein [Spirochaetota bacterium]